MKEIRVLLIGVGGYGMGYAREMLEHGAEKRASIAGVVDPYAASSPVYQALKDANVRFYDSVEAFYAADSADLAVVSTPIQFHARQIRRVDQCHAEDRIIGAEDDGQKRGHGERSDLQRPPFAARPAEIIERDARHRQRERVQDVGIAEETDEARQLAEGDGPVQRVEGDFRNEREYEQPQDVFFDIARVARALGDHEGEYREGDAAEERDKPADGTAANHIQ